jgi:DNA-directed RNA polymerase specialized sigma24 family protein
MTDKRDLGGPKEAPEDRLQRQRVGVEGDPTPDHAYRDEPPRPERPERSDGGDLDGDVEDRATTLAAAGLLTEQQARVYILRYVEGLERRGTAEWLDVTPSAVDQHASAAREKLQAARTTVRVLDDLTPGE